LNAGIQFQESMILSPCIIDLGGMETRFGKCDSQMSCVAKGIDAEILEVTGQGPIKDSYFIVLIFYVMLSYHSLQVKRI